MKELTQRRVRFSEESLLLKDISPRRTRERVLLQACYYLILQLKTMRTWRKWLLVYLNKAMMKLVTVVVTRMMMKDQKLSLLTMLADQERPLSVVQGLCPLKMVGTEEILLAQI